MHKMFIRSKVFSGHNILFSFMRDTVLGWPSLSHSRKRFDLIILYKVLYGYYGLSPNTFCELRASNTWRDQVKLAISRAKRNVRFHFFVHRGNRVQQTAKVRHWSGKLCDFNRKPEKLDLGDSYYCYTFLQPLTFRFLYSSKYRYACCVVLGEMLSCCCDFARISSVINNNSKFILNQ